MAVYLILDIEVTDTDTYGDYVKQAPATVEQYAGEPIAEDDDLFGTSINLAARICDHAEPGQIVASSVVRELAAGKDFLFSDLGETEVRGFEESREALGAGVAGGSLMEPRIQYAKTRDGVATCFIIGNGTWVSKTT